MPKEGYYFPQRELVTQASQSMVERPEIPRSKFMNTWTRKTTFDAGYLIPILVEEILPGDHMSYDITAYVRMATPLFPIFDNQKIDTFFFFVPNRLVWNNWTRFMGEQTDGPGDSINYLIPVIASPGIGWTTGTLHDHMLMPLVGQLAQSVNVNALPFRAYQLIYREWFRDENLQTITPVDKGDGPDVTAYALFKRNKPHDYFTSCLPWTQKFTPPTMPFASGLAPVKGIGYDRVGAGPATAGKVTWETPAFGVSGSTPSTTFPNSWAMDSGNGLWIKGDNSGAGWPLIYADLSQATGLATINQLRLAWLTQQMLERDARGGTRYTELVRMHFGVSSPDMRLQRPEYIGGGSTPLVMTPIAQTGIGGVGVGALGAAGTGVGKHHANYAATEHGWIIGLINVRSELSYSQGLHKKWTRSTRLDHYWPSLAGLGEQAVTQGEIWVRGGAADQTVFGYQERWQEYRTHYSEITGMFRPEATPGSINTWHLGQYFGTAPTLGDTFIQDTPPMTRVLAAGSANNNMQYLADIMFRATMVRAIPMFGTPATLGRF